MRNLKYNLSEIKHISFDLDNTLYDEYEYFKNTFKIIAVFLEKSEKIDPKITENLLNKILNEKGKHYHHLFDDFVKHLELDEKYLKKFLSLYKSSKKKITYFPGIPNLLNSLKTQYGLSIITSGIYAAQKNKINLLKAEQFFDHIIYSSKLKFDKPNEYPFRYLLKKIRLTAKEVVYVGDNPFTDFTGANKLGMLTISVINPDFRKKLIKKQYNAKIVIEKTIELKELL